MNTDKIIAETIANEYAPKNASKVLAAFERLAIITGDVQDPHFN